MTRRRRSQVQGKSYKSAPEFVLTQHPRLPNPVFPGVYAGFLMGACSLNHWLEGMNPSCTLPSLWKSSQCVEMKVPAILSYVQLPGYGGPS